MAELQHHKLGPSSSVKWLNCPGAPNAELGRPNPSNPAADEGSAAHQLGEWSLKSEHWSCAEFVGKLAYTGRDDNAKYYVTQEMAEYVQQYTDYVLDLKAELGAELQVEVRVSIDTIVPGCFGTSDSILVSPKRLDIVDLKYGTGLAVDAFENTQGLMYAEGVYQEVGGALSDIEEIYIHIHQPRLDSVSVYKISAQELTAWAKKAHEAYLRTLPEDAPRISGEKQCRWCRAKEDCKENIARVFKDVCSDIGEEFDTIENIVSGELVEAKQLTTEQLADLYSRGTEIRSVLDAIKTRLRAQAIAGVTIPGYKLVKGKGKREYVDTDKAQVAFNRKLGVDVASPRVFLSPAKVEKLYDPEGNKLRGSRLFNTHVKSKQGGVVLVDSSDAREEIKVETLPEFDSEIDN